MCRVFLLPGSAFRESASKENTPVMIRKIALGFLCLGVAVTLQAANIAQDNASNTTYTSPNNWVTGQNGGFGFTSWTIVSDTNGGFAGSFLASSSNGDNNIGTGANV